LKGEDTIAAVTQIEPDAAVEDEVGLEGGENGAATENGIAETPEAPTEE